MIDRRIPIYANRRGDDVPVQSMEHIYRNLKSPPGFPPEGHFKIPARILSGKGKSACPIRIPDGQRSQIPADFLLNRFLFRNGSPVKIQRNVLPYPFMIAQAPGYRTDKTGIELYRRHQRVTGVNNQSCRQQAGENPVKRFFPPGGASHINPPRFGKESV